MRILILLIITLAGCGASEPDVDPAKAKMGKLCERAYSSTIDSLKDVYTQAGKDMPEMPAKDVYADKCVSLGFTEDQAKCLDPKWSGGDVEGCKTTMTPVKDKAAELSKLLADAMKPPKKEAGDDKGKEGDGEGKKGKNK